MQKQNDTTVADIVTLLQRIAARDRDAFTRLYVVTSAKLYGIVLRILVRRDLADEALQDVYERIWLRAGDFDPDRASPITWMAAIARNRALDEVRRVRPVSTDETTEVMAIADAAPDAFARLAASQDAMRLERCLDGLEPERRQIMMLAFYEGMSREDLGVRFSRPAGTIKTWIHRSLAQLKDCLGQ